jgi:hypothetical protein
VSDSLASDDAPAVAAAGQRFAREELSEEALHCYWLGVLLRYAELYFSEPAAGRGAAS